VARRDFGPQLTKRFLDFLARYVGHGRNWASLIRRQLSGGHDDALDVRPRHQPSARLPRLEAAGGNLGGRPETGEKIVAALFKGGIEFLDDGQGVRLKLAKAKGKRK
jgi:hypothetical protein